MELGLSARFRLRPLVMPPMAAPMTSANCGRAALLSGGEGSGLPGLLGTSGAVTAGLSMQREPSAEESEIRAAGGDIGVADEGGRGKRGANRTVGREERR